MSPRFAPLICCGKCGMIRRGDAAKCSGMNLKKEPCEGALGQPLLVDLQRQQVYVDTIVEVEPFAPGDDKKIIIASDGSLPRPPKPNPPNLKLEP